MTRKRRATLYTAGKMAKDQVVHLHPMKNERINRIKELLVIKGYSQKWLALQLGKSPTAVTSFCNNNSQPHLKDLKRIAAILDVDIRELLVPTKE